MYQCISGVTGFKAARLNVKHFQFEDSPVLLGLYFLVSFLWRNLFSFLSLLFNYASMCSLPSGQLDGFHASAASQWVNVVGVGCLSVYSICVRVGWIYWLTDIWEWCLSFMKQSAKCAFHFVNCTFLYIHVTVQLCFAVVMSPREFYVLIYCCFSKWPY